MRHIFVIAAFVLTVSPLREAFAQAPAGAEEAFQRGRTDLAAGHYAEACRNFEQSVRLDRASGALLALAYCQELTGLLASAATNYRAAAELAQVEGHPERRDVANDQYRALAERVSILTIVVPPSLATAPGLRVTLDGVEVNQAQFGAPMPINGGTYRIQAAIGSESWSSTVSLSGERDRRTLVVELLPRPASNAAAAAPTASSPARAKDPVEPARGSRTLEHVSIGIGVGALVTLGVGTVAGIVASSKNHASSRDGHCDETGCDARGLELRDQALTAAHVATWSFVAGGILAAGGVALYFGSKSSSQHARLGVRGTFALGGGDVAFSQSF